MTSDDLIFYAAVTGMILFSIAAGFSLAWGG